MIKSLEAEAVRRRCDPEKLRFETTADLEELDQSIGQPRVVTALEFGVGHEREGYNIFALGPSGSGRHTLIHQFLDQRAAEKAVPSDWCHVYNFDEPNRPRLLRLPAAVGVKLRRDMTRLTEELRAALAAAFESEEFQTRRQVIEEEFKARSERLLAEFEAQARSRGVAVMKTPMGVAFAPMGDDKVMAPEEFRELPEARRKELEEVVKQLEKEFQEIARQMPKWERERQEKLRELSREVTKYAVDHLIEELKGRYGELENVGRYLDAVKADVIENARNILQPDEPGAALQAAGGGDGGSRVLRRYQANVLVDHSADESAPVVYEDNPTFQNLMGRVEHVAQLGALVTDFTLIRGGALHRANGGYLILDAPRVLTHPFAWEGLKRALQSQCIRIESPGEAWGLASTVSLEPEPVPLDLKVILVGEPIHYYLLSWHDSDFRKLFKVAADFDEAMDRDEEGEALYARLIATLVASQELLPFHKTAVARVIEHASRLLGDAHKLTTRLYEVGDLLQESAYWASQAGAEVVLGDHVEEAIEARTYRADRLRERTQEQILRDTVLIETDGARVGQVNGLAVAQLGSFAFGRPSRITARVRMGKGEVVDIEREVDLGGPLHAKGVLILSAFLSSRFARDRPLALSASLVFEQSYAGVDGDSASSTELYALLSAIAEVPIRQSLAVTGSVNQLGQVQAIGGVNEKVEGFFDLCRARGLTGEQGVLIPKANVQHLMLRKDVVAAVAQDRFHIYPVETIDQGIEVLTGIAAGEADDDGSYPQGTLNQRIETRLAELARKARQQSAPRSSEEPP